MKEILLQQTVRLYFVIEIIGCNILYLTDYQGNISGVVNAATKKMEQYQDYYPYGKPHDTAVDGCDNRRKIGGKGLITDKGYDAYDFEARPLTLTLTILRFTQPDNKAENNYPTSIYAYCGGDPIKLIDPTGENAKVVIDGNTITIKANIILTGPLANKDVAKTYQENINNTWGKLTNYTFLGLSFSLNWDVEVRVIGTNKEIDYNEINNYIDVVSLPETSSVRGTNSGSCANIRGYA